MAEVRGESLTIDWQWPEQKSGEEEKNKKIEIRGQEKTEIRDKNGGEICVYILQPYAL